MSITIIHANASNVRSFDALTVTRLPTLRMIGHRAALTYGAEELETDLPLPPPIFKRGQTIHLSAASLRQTLETAQTSVPQHEYNQSLPYQNLTREAAVSQMLRFTRLSYCYNYFLSGNAPQWWR